MGKSICHFFDRFKGLNTLIAMQLKDKLDMSFKADKKGAIIKLVLRALLFIIVTAAIYVVFYLLGQLGTFGTTTTSFPYPIFNFIFSIMLILSTLSCIGSLTKSLYFSRDNLTLLSYPVRSNTVFLSKIVVFYILSLLREIAFILPLFLAFGFLNGLSIGYYFWLILMYFIICAIPVAIAAIVSIPWMYITMYFRKHPLAQDIALLIILMGASAGLFVLIDMIPANLHFLTRWADYYYPKFLKFCMDFEHWCPPTYYVSSVTTGATYETINIKGMPLFNSTTLPVFFTILACVIGCIVLAYFFAKPLFFKMSAKPFEYNKKIIFHNYDEDKQKVKSEYYQFGYLPKELIDRQLTQKERYQYIAKLEKALNNLIREEKIFGDSVSDSRILRLLKTFTNMDFEVVPMEEFIKHNSVGYVVRYDYGTPSLVLAKSEGRRRVSCYDPNYLSKQNHPKNSFFSMMWKDILMGIRTPGSLASGFLLMIITPLAIALMNKLFQSINTSFMGDKFVIMFNIMMFTMIPLVSNVSMASVYSREGESSYLLKASPANYIKTLSSKLALRWVLILVSIMATTIVYGHYCTILFSKPAILGVSILLLYTGHLIWSAELDYMNPRDQLYKEVGEGSINNSNETLSGIFAFLITALFTLIAFFLMDENPFTVFYKLLFISALFIIARVILAVFKVKGYRTSRGERGRN